MHVAIWLSTKTGHILRQIPKAYLRYRSSAKAPSDREATADQTKHNFFRHTEWRHKARLRWNLVYVPCPCYHARNRTLQTKKQLMPAIPEIERKTDWIAHVTWHNDVGRTWQEEEDDTVRHKPNPDIRATTEQFSWSCARSYYSLRVTD
jgi:hypothetical protein